MAKMIRGVTAKKYAEYMHDIEAGRTTEAKLVRAGKLKPSSRRDNRAINKHRDNKLFSNRSKVRGHRSKKEECLVPHCHNKASRRGLCNTHRSYAYKMIELKKTTETNLISRKLMLPKASGGDQTKHLRKKKTKKKRVAKKAIKRVRVKTKKKTKKVKKRPGSRVSFPEKLLNSDICLYPKTKTRPKCKTSRKGGGRGLCARHYSQYKRKRKKLSTQARRKLDRDLIRRRLLLPARAQIVKQAQDVESSAFEIGSAIRGSIRRW
jgi:hypothetical protein